MNNVFAAKFLGNLLNKKRNNEGFTLIELLVVIIIIGILAAIALPSFLNQANKARQVEAKTYVGSMNRAQQAYYLEKTEFVTDTGDIGLLELGVSDSENYEYTITNAGTLSTDPAGILGANNVATPTDDASGNTKPLRGYTGQVEVGEATDGNATTFAYLCEGDVAVAPPTSCTADSDARVN